MNQPKQNKNFYLEKTKESKIPAWLIPALIISILAFSLLYFLPKIIRSFQSGSTTENISAESTTMKDSFLEEADAVISVKTARIFNRADKNGDCITSALYNEPIILLTEKPENGFYHIQLREGISGYVDEADILISTKSFDSAAITDRAIIINGEKAISSDTINGDIVAIAPMGCILYIDYVTEQVIRVVLPGGEIGWLNRENLIVVPLNKKIPQPDSKQADIFCSSALKFLNISYIPGGLGLDNIDMPGVIYLAGITNGLSFSRRIEDQAELGTNISFEKDEKGIPNINGFKAGDLLFFSGNEKEINSVAIYLADDNILYAEGNQSEIQILSMSGNDRLLERLSVARRIFE